MICLAKKMYKNWKKEGTLANTYHQCQQMRDRKKLPEETTYLLQALSLPPEGACIKSDEVFVHLKSDEVFVYLKSDDVFVARFLSLLSF